MATSGSKSISVTSYDTLKFSWSQKSQSIANNTTTISWKLELIATSYGRIDSSVSKSWSVTVNGTKYSGTNTVGIGNNSTKTLASGTTTISHKSDGTMSFSYAFTQEFAITFSGTYIGSKSGSGTGTLNTIPRASTFGTITGNTIGSNVTVNITRKSTSFTHHLYYKIGNSGWVDLGSGITTSKTFTIDLYRCQEFPNATSGTMQIKMSTYNGSTKIGNDVTKTMTVYVPTSVVPTISSVTVSEGGTLVPSSWGVYVQNKSKIKFVTNASGLYGSTISSVKVTFNNSTLTGSTVTTGIISKSGTLTATIKVTDSRGRTKSTTKSVTIQPYAIPHATVSAERTTGTNATISIVGAVSSVSNKNTYTYSLKYKKSNATSYTTRSITGAYSLDTDLTLDVFDTESSYDLYVQVSDQFTTVTSNVFVLSSEYALIDYLNGGKGIAFGKVAELKNFMDVNLSALFRNNIIANNSLRLGQFISKETPPVSGIEVLDLRDCNPVAGMFGDRNINFYFADIDGIWRTVMSITGWNANTQSYATHEISFNAHSDITSWHQNILHRTGIDGTWTEWQTLLDSRNASSICLSISGGTVNGSISTLGNGETSIGPCFDGGRLYFYGNNSTGARGIYDSEHGSVLAYNSDESNYIHRGNYFMNEKSTYVNVSTRGGGASIRCDNGTYSLYLEKDCWRPQASNSGAFNLGTSVAKWKQLYATTTTISTSDRNSKQDFTEFDGRYESFFNDLKPQVFRFKDGESKRFHSGYISQDVEESLLKNGLTALDFGGFCKDKKKVVVEITDNNGEKIEDVLDENGQPVYEYSLRYEEFIALNTHMIQKQQKEIDELKKQIEELTKLVKGT